MYNFDKHDWKKRYRSPREESLAKGSLNVQNFTDTEYLVLVVLFSIKW